LAEVSPEKAGGGGSIPSLVTTESIAYNGTLVGTSIGSLIGVLGGPVGVALGATADMAAGRAVDLSNVGLGYDFIDDVAKALLPNKVAVIAEIEEDWTPPVDTRMEATGGTGYWISYDSMEEMFPALYWPVSLVRLPFCAIGTPTPRRQHRSLGWVVV
jgi:hypothetical protein